MIGYYFIKEANIAIIRFIRYFFFNTGKYSFFLSWTYSYIVMWDYSYLMQIYSKILIIYNQQGRSDQSDNYKLSLKAPGVSPVNCLKMRWNVLRSLKPESKPMASIVRSSFPASDIRRIASFTRYSFT